MTSSTTRLKVELADSLMCEECVTNNYIMKIYMTYNQLKEKNYKGVNFLHNIKLPQGKIFLKGGNFFSYRGGKNFSKWVKI